MKRRRQETERARTADIISEAIAGVLQRPGRSVLTVIGVTLGVGAFIVILGITSTANGQITKTFNSLSATQVTVTERTTNQDDTTPQTGFTDKAENALDRINGVQASAVRTEYFPDANVNRFAPGTNVQPKNVRIIAVSNGYTQAAGLKLTSGRTFDTNYLNHKRTALISDTLAATLDLTQDRLGTTLYIQSVPFTIIGTYHHATRDPDARTSILIPLEPASTTFGPPQGIDPPQILIHTHLGAAHTVAEQAPLALDPYHPDRYNAAALAEPTKIRDKVANDLAKLFVLLSGICLIIGAFSIANTTLIGVLERTSEIGLRRALGAKAHHIGIQFLLETTLLGAAGGLIGSTLGLLAVTGTAILQNWTAIIAPWTVLIGPAIGAGAGLVAGLYPSIRAARIEPLDALRR